MPILAVDHIRTEQRRACGASPPKLLNPEGAGGVGKGSELSLRAGFFTRPGRMASTKRLESVAQRQGNHVGLVVRARGVTREVLRLPGEQVGYLGTAFGLIVYLIMVSGQE